MGRASTVHALPLEVRQEIDYRLLTLRQSQLDCLAWLRAGGHRISRSALNRYAQALFAGAEELKPLAVAGRPLGAVVAEAVAETDPLLAELVQELLTLQMRQLAVLRRLQDHMRERQLAAAAREWVAARRSGGTEGRA